MKFRVKICGLTNVAEAVAAVEAGADAIGLNFFEGSRRRIEVDEAQRIVAAVSSQVTPVGVFVNAPAEYMQEICRQVGLHVIQLHGEESPKLLKLLQPEFEVIRARRLDGRGMAAVRDDLLACGEIAGEGPSAILLDAAVAGEFGGTGQVADWSVASSHKEWIGDVPLILAGGLKPGNVADAIRMVQPQAVDTASGVESRPGHKDHALMREFVAESRRAFATFSTDV